MENTISLKKSEIAELVKLTNEINERMECLGLMSDEKFMKSFKKAKEQIKKLDFSDWNAL